jgi:glycosyltransferase involved in cell wall biosynthesis
MKILFLTDNFPPEVNAPATRTFEHCLEWRRSGAEITVITGAPNFPQGKVYPGYKNRLRLEENMEGIRVIRVWTYMAPNKGFLRRIMDYVSFMVSAFFAGLFVRTDLIIATSPQFFTAVAGSLLGRLRRKPWIMEVRDLWPDSVAGVEAVKSKKALSFFYWLEKRLYRHATMIVPVTDTFKKEIIAKGTNPAKIHVIKNGSNLEKFFPREKNINLIRELGLEGKFIVGYIGTFGMAHGLDFFAQFASELEPMGIVFLMIGDGARKEDLKKTVQAKAIRNMILLDPVSKERISDYLSILDVSLIPLRKATIFTTVIPSKIFESAAMQIPILLGVEGESRGIIEHYGAGLFFEPENKDDFVRQLKQLKDDRVLYDSCREGGKNLSIDFDRRRLAREFYLLIGENVMTS